MTTTNEAHGASPDLAELADLFRSVEFAVSHGLSVVIATVGCEEVMAMNRDLDRLLEVNRQVRAMLKRLPPEPPMTAERMERVGVVVRAVLAKRFGEGTQGELDGAVEAAWPSGGEAVSP